MSSFRSPIRVIQADFRAGEIDPLFSMRVDSTAYPSGARRLTNMLLRATGSAERRPGTVTLEALSGRSRLIGFEFDLDEKYICAFRNGAVSIYNPDGSFIVAFTSQPWNTTTLWELNVVQKGDVMIIVHPSFKMKELRRTGASTFTLAYIEFSSDTSDAVLNQPYMKYGAATITVGISDWTIGAGRTLTTNGNIFSSAWVGDRIRIYNCEMVVTAYVNTWTVTVSVLQEVRKRLDPAPFRYDDSTTTVEVTHALHGLTTGSTINISGASDFDTVLESEINGNRVITVVDEDRYTIVCDGAPPGVSGDGGGPAVFIKTQHQTRDWMEPVWSWRRGWPGAICLHENRIWMGGSIAAPTFLAGSTIGSYYDFNIGDGFDDESVQGHISTLARIRHLVSGKTLQIFTETSEAVIDTQQGNPITPGTLKVVTNSSYGSGNVPPELFDGATLFIQRTGKNIRELVYDFNSDTWVGIPVSLLASHIIATPRDMAVLAGTTTRSEQYAFIVNSNGTVACFHSARSEKLEAWTQFVCGGGGRFDSVCVIGSSVYFSVLRDSVYWIERFELDATGVWLDGLVEIAGPDDTYALGARYAGKTVSCMSNGNYLGDYTADGSGVVTLPFITTDIIAGYDYDVAVTPLPPDKELQDGPMTGEIRRIVSATVHFHNSVSAAVNGNQTIGFSVGDDPSLPPRAISGKRRVRLLGYGRDPEINITQPAPGPLTVLGLTLEVSL